VPHRDTVLLAKRGEPAVQVRIVVLLSAVVCHDGHSSHGALLLEAGEVHI
jgi:hypothetical protein